MISSRNISFILYLTLSGLMLQGCVEFKEVALYDGMEPLPSKQKPESIESLLEPIIFEDNTNDTWGIVGQDIGVGDCGTSKLTYEHVHSGLTAIELTWNRDAEGCSFAGVGFGWDGWAGKDLSELMDYAAIEFYVRSQKGRMFGLPIVLTLEDYSGGMGFAYTDNKYFERTAIDEEWQKVVVPLSSFDVEIENLDPSNIKQLQLELQQSGSIYLDDIKMVFYEAQEQTPWMLEEELPDPLATPIEIFSDAFINNNGFGLVSNECQQFELSDKKSFNGLQSIHAKWNEKEACSKYMSFGASWNKWKPVDLTSAINTHAFKFMIKNNGDASDKLPLYIGIQDYDRVVDSVQVSSKYLSEGQFDSEWREVIVPLSAFEGTFDFTRVKLMGFKMKESGDVYIDDIQFITLESD